MSDKTGANRDNVSDGPSHPFKNEREKWAYGSGPGSLEPGRGHMRFVGGTILCPRISRRYNLGLDHHIHDEFVCPGCGVRVPAKVVA